MTIYFEDLTDDAIESMRVTVTEAHIVTFAGLTGDFNPLHMDEVAASDGPFGRRIAHGMLSYSLSTGMRSAIDDWAILAFMGTQRSFLAPVFIGDTLHYRARLQSGRRSASRPDRAIVVVELNLLNQQGQVVQAGEDTFAVACRPEGLS